MQPAQFKKLEERSKENNRRELIHPSSGIDFYSNDYLNLRDYPIELSVNSVGSGGSRLIAGNSIEAIHCEAFLANFFHSEASLVFNSGYDANVGLFSSIAGKNDTIIYDEYIHASVRDGIKLSNARNFSFKHNNVEDLQKKIALANGSVFVAVESLYSMDGDFSPLLSIATLCKEKGCFLIVDEAHSAGVFGPSGKGICVQEKIEQLIFARLITFGKAYGFHGAAILGSKHLKSFLINFARSFIYTTALPPSSYELIQLIVEHPLAEQQRKKIQDTINLYSQLCELHGRSYHGNSPIQLIQGTDLDTFHELMNERSVLHKIIRYPTVPQGYNRIRICLHANHTEADLLKLF